MSAASSASLLDALPEPKAIRQDLSRTVTEAYLLRRLLRLCERISAARLERHSPELREPTESSRGARSSHGRMQMAKN